MNVMPHASTVDQLQEVRNFTSRARGRLLFEDVARGFLAVAKADESRVQAVEADSTYLSDRMRQSQLFLLRDLGGQRAVLGRQAIALILESGLDYRQVRGTEMEWQQAVGVRIVLPAWGTSERPVRHGELVLVKVRSSGVFAERFSPYIRTDDDAIPCKDPRAYLDYLLGVRPAQDFWAESFVGCDVDETVGFPGAEKLIRDELPRIGQDLIVAAGR